MFLLSLSRIIKFSFQNFFRNFWLSVVTITIIVLTLFSVTCLVFINAITEQSVNIVKSKVDVSLYFNPTTTPEQVFGVQGAIENLPYVKNVEYVSKSDALVKLREQYKDSELILESLKELDNNPLGDTLIVNTQQTSDYQKVVDFVNGTEQYAVLIDSQSFDDNGYIIDKLEKITSQVKRIGWGVTIFFAVISLLVIINTIRIAIYTHRDEISIMRLVGASNRFIRGPFVGEAILYAFLGSIITFVLTYFVAAFSDPYVQGLLGQTDFSLMKYLTVNVFLIFGGEMIGIIFISVIATSLALRRYLKI
jgi:cell division transport system permease protein